MASVIRSTLAREQAGRHQLARDVEPFVITARGYVSPDTHDLMQADAAADVGVWGVSADEFLPLPAYDRAASIAAQG